MSKAANYAVVEVLRDGRTVKIRALRPEDRDELLAAVERTSTQSLFRRFFGAKRGFTEQEIAFFLDIDFVDHVALVAVVDEGDRPTIVGGGRYVVMQSETAEVAFVVIDTYQGQGLGAALMKHLAGIARSGGIKKFIAEVLPENIAMLKVFEKSVFDVTTQREPRVVHVSLQL